MKGLSLMQGIDVQEAEESGDSSAGNQYAAHIVRQGLSKEGWKLVITGAAMLLVVHMLAASGSCQPL